MSEANPEVAVLIVTHNSKHFLADCLTSVMASEDPGIHRHVVVVDNASADGSGEFVTSEFPQVDLVRSPTNRGFTGGNNLGWEHVQQAYPDTDYLMLLNPDTIVAPGWLEPLAEFLRGHPEAGCAQPKLLLHPQTDLFNTTGNRSQFLGFAFVSGYEVPDRGQYDSPEPLDYASGAAVMIRTDLLRRVGLFEEMMFLYHDDLELGWRLRQIGFGSFLVPASAVYHKYNFRKNLKYYYFFERNRWLVLGIYYKLPTLLLLAPALAVMELGQLFFALTHRVLGQKLRSYGFFLRPANLGTLWRRRRQAQARRTITDREFTRPFCGSIDLPGGGGLLLKYIANPFFRAYWSVARRLIFW